MRQGARNASPLLTTERLVVQPLTFRDIADATAAEDLLMESDEQNREWIRRWGEHQSQHGYSYWGCRTREAGTLVGFCGWRSHDLGVALGYAIAAPYRGRGLAKEAAAKVVAWGVANIGVDLLFASIRPPSPASCRVLEHSGMRRTLEYADGQGPRWVYALPARAAVSVP